MLDQGQCAARFARLEVAPGATPGTADVHGQGAVRTVAPFAGGRSAQARVGLAEQAAGHVRQQRSPVGHGSLTTGAP